MKKLIFGLLMLLAFAACHKNKGVILPGSQNPDTNVAAVTDAGAPAGAIVQKTIGAAGGTIASSDGKLLFTVPAGALDADVAISVQPIENKSPLGMKGRAYRFLPHGLQFKKTATLMLAYDDNDIAGSQPEQVGLVTQTNNGTWKKTGNLQVNLNNRTLTAGIVHFSDYAFYEAFTLKDAKTNSDTSLIKLRPTEEVKLTVQYVNEVRLDADIYISLPSPASGYVKEWTVNGMVTPPNLDFGGLAGKTGYNMAERDYVSPRIAPNPNSITVTVKLDLGSKGVLFLLRNITIIDANVLGLNGKVYNGATPSAIFLNNNTALNFGINKSFPNGKSASVAVTIEDIASPAPGAYNFSASEKVKIVAHDEFGNVWSSEKHDPHTGITNYNGNVQVTVTGSGNFRQLFIKVTGMLFGASATVNGAPVNTIIDTNAPVF